MSIVARKWYGMLHTQADVTLSHVSYKYTI